MDLVYFEYDCYGKKMEVKNPKYYDDNGQLLPSEKVNHNSLYTQGNILDSYLVLGKNGTGKTTFFKELSRITSSDDNKECLENNNVFFANDEYVKDYNLEKIDISIINIRKDYINKGYGIFVNEKEFLINFKQSDMLNFIVKDFQNDENKSILNFSRDRKLFLNLKDEIKIKNSDIFKEFLNCIKNNNKLVIILYIYISFLNLIVSKCLETNNEWIEYLSDNDEYDYFEVKNFIEKEIVESYRNDIYNIFKTHKNIDDIKLLNMLADTLCIKKFEMKEFIDPYDYPDIEDYEEYIDKNVLNEWEPQKNSITHFFGNLITKYNDETKDDFFNCFNIDDLNFEKMQFKLDNIVGNEKFKKFLEEFLDLNELYNYINLDSGFSAGEQSLIELISCITTAIEKNNKNSLKKQNDKNKICYLLLDEIEQNLHPEWCRLLYSKIVDVINKSDENNKFYIYLTTHSPYIVSDFTSDHIINLDEQDNKNEFQTFGANIHDILSKGMFLDNPMGEYAYSMIRRVHKALCTGLSREEILEASGMDSEEKLRYFIDSIGEPLIKMQLRSLYEKVFEVEKNKIKISKEDLKNIKTEEQLIQLLNNCNIEIE